MVVLAAARPALLPFLNETGGADRREVCIAQADSIRPRRAKCIFVRDGTVLGV